MPPVTRAGAGHVLLTVSDRQRTWHLPYGWPQGQGALPLPDKPASTLCEIGEPIVGALSTSDLLLLDLLQGAEACQECAGVIASRLPGQDLSTIVDWRKPKDPG